MAYAHVASKIPKSRHLDLPSFGHLSGVAEPLATTPECILQIPGASIPVGLSSQMASPTAETFPLAPLVFFQGRPPRQQ